VPGFAMNPQQFASDWADAWNRRAIEHVLAHFHEDIRFTSPTALVVTGAATVKGKDALRDYWMRAMSKVESIRFTLDRVLWDETRREMAIIYTAAINGGSRKVSENLVFDSKDQVVRAEVFHGAPVDLNS
jgi:ketosteroid isomerase-like protein